MSQTYHSKRFQFDINRDGCQLLEKIEPMVNLDGLLNKENWSYNFFTFRVLFYQFFSFFARYDECLIKTCFYTIVDLDVPILQWCANCLNLSPYALFYRRKYYPTIQTKTANRRRLSNKNAELLPIKIVKFNLDNVWIFFVQSNFFVFCFFV